MRDQLCIEEGQLRPILHGDANVQRHKYLFFMLSVNVKLLTRNIVGDGGL